MSESELYVAVRPEFLRPRVVATQIKLDPPPPADHALPAEAEKASATEEEAKNLGKRKHDGDKGKDFKKLTLKQRHTDTHVSKEDRLCSAISRGETCSYGDKCQYNHDIASYLKTKPTDLGPVCHVYAAYGFCSNGLMCRWGSSHIDPITFANKQRPESEGGVIPRPQINVLRKELQLQLRKKSFPFPDISRWLQGGSKKDKDKGKAAEPSSSASATAAAPSFDLSAYPSQPVKLVDFSNKVYIAPLTTVGNLPFRRVLKDFGADITCGEMAMGSNLLAGQASEWALLRKHSCEDVFGVQIAVPFPDLAARVGAILAAETDSSFVDLNCGCPIDALNDKGCGAALMLRSNRLLDILSALRSTLPASRGLTVKLRTGWSDQEHTILKIMPQLQQRFSLDENRPGLSAVFIHGRSRQQRYSRLADWQLVLQAAQSQDPSLPLLPVIGNGDILSYHDWYTHRSLIRDNMTGDQDVMGLTSCAMIGRGALIKPWLPAEIKQETTLDLSASQRFDMLQKFVNYGLEHWGSDLQGINTTRRFLLEWLSFLHRYVPSGIIEAGKTQTMAQRPPSFNGRGDMETLMASPLAVDWLKIAEQLLGPPPEGFVFVPKHKSNAYPSNPRSSGDGQQSATATAVDRGGGDTAMDEEAENG